MIIRANLVERHSLDEVYRSDDWPKILDHEAHDPYSGRQVKPAKGFEPEHSMFQKTLLKIRRISEEPPDYLHDAGSVRIRLKWHSSCTALPPEDSRPGHRERARRALLALAEATSAQRPSGEPVAD